MSDTTMSRYSPASASRSGPGGAARMRAGRDGDEGRLPDRRAAVGEGAARATSSMGRGAGAGAAVRIPSRLACRLGDYTFTCHIRAARAARKARWRSEFEAGARQLKPGYGARRQSTGRVAPRTAAG